MSDRALENLKAILAQCKMSLEIGLHFIILTKRWRRPPRNWDRARVIPGCSGHVVGSVDRGRYLVSVKIDVLVPALERMMGVAP